MTERTEPTAEITPAMLLSKRACDDQLAIFIAKWPKGGKVTLAKCREAVRLGLNLDWAANKLPKATAWKVYREAKATAWKVYDEATAPAWKAYCEATATAFYEAWLIDHPKERKTK